MAKSIADKIDAGAILLDVVQEDIEKLENILSQTGCKIPNVKLSIYKNRRGQYNKIFMWMYADKGTCRFNTLFVTNWNYELIPMKEVDIKVVQNELR